MQVYKGLDIGTAKITEREKQGINHYMVDILEPNQRFTAADFIDLTNKDVATIAKHRHLPIMVGGTGFYLQALLDGYKLGSSNSVKGQKVRQSLSLYAKKNGKQALWRQLSRVDPKAAQNIPVNNERRVIRALEVYKLTGQLFSNQKDEPNNKLEPLIIGLNTERHLLYQRIDHRVDQMMSAGLLDEAHRLYDRGRLDLPGAKGIGYKELFAYFAGKASLNDCVELVKKNSRHYAKRQLTWFRNKMNVTWFDLVLHPEQEKNVVSQISSWLKEQ